MIYAFRHMRALFLCFIFLSATEEISEARKMEAQRECATCHIMWLDTFRIEGQVTLIDLIPMDEQIGAGAAEEDMCYSCHDGFVLDSRNLVWTNHRHPVDIKPPKKIKLPKRNDGTTIFPLDLKGNVYCGTCHSAHGVAWGGEKQEDIPLFMRGSNKNSRLCKMCHSNKKGGALNGNHPIDKTSIPLPEKLFKAGGKKGSLKDQVICQSCYMIHGAKGEKILLVKNDNSKLCGICHSDRYTSTKAEAQKQSTHPVNIKSDTVNITKSVAAIGGKTGTDQEIICESCHRPHAAKKGRGILVKSNSDSALCQECHKSKRSVLITKHNMQKAAPEALNVNGQTP
ncbi:hypothetical protein KAR91_70980, partial [Candidatus Pacearchaeota archaeon]|nr:hypothetical protein [Candidatus Pacearchaeota archaeon]